MNRLLVERPQWCGIFVVLMCVGGCFSSPLVQNRTLGVKVRALNSSTVFISEVVLVSGKEETIFGYLGPSRWGKTWGGCLVNTRAPLSVRWEESNEKHSYFFGNANDMPEIRSSTPMEIAYQGSGVWTLRFVSE